jgi:hypothetical protein
LSYVLEGEHAEGLASFDDGQSPEATLLQEPINLPEELTFRGSFGDLALASRFISPLRGCRFLDRSLAAEGRSGIGRKAEARKINGCAFGNVSRPVALSPEPTFSLARHEAAIRLGQPLKNVWGRDRRLQTRVHISPTARSIAVE